MADRTLSFNLVGKDVSASQSMTKLADTSNTVSTKIGASFQKLGSQIGGEFGELLSVAGDGFNKVGENASNAGEKLMAVGAGVGALGLAMGHLASGEQAAQQQLQQAIVASGGSWSDYSDEIEKAISKGADYGHSGTDVQNALAKMTESTGDAGKALDQMTLVENIAAAKHEDLSSAANQLSLAMNGNSKVFKQFGIDLGTTKPTAEQLNTALTELSNKLSGQAAAASDTFDGKIKSLQTHLGDMAAQVSEKVYPALTAAAPVLLGIGAATDLWAQHTAKAADAATSLTAASDLEAASSAKADAALMSQSVTAQTLSDDMLGLRLAEVNAALANDNLGASAVTAATEQGALGASLSETAESGAAMGPLGLAIGGVTLAVGLGAAAWKLFGDSSKASAAEITSLTSAIEADNGAMGKNTEATVANALEKSGALDAARALGLNLNTVTQAALGNTDAINAVNQATQYYQAGTYGASDSTGKLATAAKTLENALGTQTGAVQTAAQAAKNVTDAQTAAAASTTKLSTAATAATPPVTTLQQGLANLNQIYNPQIQLSGAAAASSELRSLQGQLVQFNSTSIKVGSSGPVAHASGGMLSGNTMDEAGIEGLRLPNDTMVIPHGQTMQAMQAGGRGNGTVINNYEINVSVPAGYSQAPNSEIGRAVASHLSMYLGTGGTIGGSASKAFGRA